jgi:hypothetical protein
MMAESPKDSSETKAKTAINLNETLGKIKAKFKFIENLQAANRSSGSFTHSSDAYAEFDGKQINHIYIQVIDPAGKTVHDPDNNNVSRFDKFLNRMTVNTPKWVVKKELLFKEGDAVNAHLFAETEMLFRQNNHFKDILIRIVPLDESQWVDVYIVLQDRWALSLAAEVSGSYVAGGFYLENYFGLSQDFKQMYYVNFNKNNPLSFEGMYRYRNIAGSRIAVKGYYKIDKLNYKYGFSLDRPFVSSKNKWACSVSSYWFREHVGTPALTLDNEVRYNEQNVWLAGAFNPHIRNEKFDQMRLILAGRFKRDQYTKRPYASNIDLGQYYFIERYYVLSLGLANWETYKEKDVFNITYYDYLPKGINFNITGGVQYYERFSHRFYTGAVINHGISFKGIGYQFVQANFGGYITSKTFEQISLKLEHKFFTKRIPMAKWGFRQFVYNTVQLGFNRPYGTEYDLNGGNGGLTGLNSLSLHGNQKYVLNLEEVIYCPWKVLGFSASLFAFADLAVVWDINADYRASRFTQAYGAGIRFNNPGLGLGYIELGMVYYPVRAVADMPHYAYEYNWRNSKEIINNNLFTPNSVRPLY